MLSCELQELQQQLAHMEEQVKSAEQQKSHFQRLLQENKKRLAPLQLELQQIIEKVGGGHTCLLASPHKEQGPL